MGEPERTVMGMVMLLIGSGFHGPIARHRGIARPDEWITIRPRDILEKIFAEQLAIQLNVGVRKPSQN